MIWDYEFEPEPTALDKVKERYVKGDLTLKELNEHISYLLVTKRDEEKFVIFPRLFYTLGFNRWYNEVFLPRQAAREEDDSNFISFTLETSYF